MRHVRFAVAVLVLFTASSTRAAWVDTFAGGTPQQTWVYAAQPDGSNFTASYFSDGVRLESTAAITGQPGGGAAAVFGVVNKVFDSSVSVRAVVNPDGEDDLWLNVGLLAHLNPVLGNGYSLTIKYDEDTHSADISKITGGTTIVGLESEAIPGFSTTATYILELDVVGTHLTGRVYDTDENLLLTLSAIDPNPYTSGVAGILAQRDFGDPTLLGVFGMVSAVPEPGSLLLVVLGALALALRRRRRHG
ncbi:MAG: PEP-CTERM sorting domain-containing protein [Patescibacteria group bacterium]|nr:PEP-CTERM sorting domain-containing protein [Patescibacteria group bacterium]